MKASTTGNVAPSSDPTSQDNQLHSMTEVLPFVMTITASILVNLEISLTPCVNPALHHLSIDHDHASPSRVKTMHDEEGFYF